MVLSCDVIIWDDNTPLFYFSCKLHSLNISALFKMCRKTLRCNKFHQIFYKNIAQKENKYRGRHYLGNSWVRWVTPPHNSWLGLLKIKDLFFLKFFILRVITRYLFLFLFYLFIFLLDFTEREYIRRCPRYHFLSSYLASSPPPPPNPAGVGPTFSYTDIRKIKRIVG